MNDGEHIENKLIISSTISMRTENDDGQWTAMQLHRSLTEKINKSTQKIRFKNAMNRNEFGGNLIFCVWNELIKFMSEK